MNVWRKISERNERMLSSHFIHSSYHSLGCGKRNEVNRKNQITLPLIPLYLVLSVPLHSVHHQTRFFLLSSVPDSVRSLCVLINYKRNKWVRELIKHTTERGTEERNHEPYERNQRLFPNGREISCFLPRPLMNNEWWNRCKLNMLLGCVFYLNETVLRSFHSLHYVSFK